MACHNAARVTTNVQVERDEEDEDWVLTSHDEARADYVQSSPYLSLDFHLQTRLGTVSFQLGHGQGEEKSLGTGNERSTLLQEQSPLFKLPAELRLQIYQHVLHIPTDIFGLHLGQRSWEGSPPTVLTVLLTCRRVLAEAEEVFYFVNRLCVAPHPFIASLGPRRRAAITRFTMPIPSSGSMLSGLQQLLQLPNLRSLYVRRNMSIKYIQVSSWAVMAPQLATEIRKMKQLVDFRIITPGDENLTDDEMARQARLTEVDQTLYDAVPSSSSSSH